MKTGGCSVSEALSALSEPPLTSRGGGAARRMRMRTPDQSHHLHFSVREFAQVFNDFASVSNTGRETSIHRTVLGGVTVAS